MTNRKPHSFWIFGLLLVLVFSAGQASAVIYLDENFDGASFFTNLNWPIQDSSSTVTTGPITAALKVTYNQSNFPIYSYQIVLHSNVDRIDLIERIDRTKFAYVPYSSGGLHYGLAWAFNLTTASMATRFDTAAGWFQPGTADNLAFPGAYNPQNGMNLSEASYGITIGSRDVMCHSANDVKCGAYPPPTATVVDEFVVYGNQCLLEGGSYGTVQVEQAAPNQWDLRYSIRPHRSAFDYAREGRVGYQVCAPLEGRHVAAGTAGPFSANTISFFSIDAGNVYLTSVKNADFGSDLIVKVSEVGESQTTTYLRSGHFNFYKITEVTPTEEDVSVLLDNPSGQNNWQFSIAPQEIRYFRVDVTP